MNRNKDRIIYKEPGGVYRKKKRLTKLEQIRKNLKEIFTYYCRQQIEFGYNPSFEQIRKIYKRLNLAKWLMFCRDFRIIRT